MHEEMITEKLHWEWNLEELPAIYAGNLCIGDTPDPTLPIPRNMTLYLFLSSQLFSYYMHVHAAVW